MAKKNRKIFDAIKKDGYSETDIRNFCEGYLELLSQALVDDILSANKGVQDTDLARKMNEDKLIYKHSNGKLYIED